MGLKDLMVRIRADNSELDKAVIESSRRMEQVGKRLDRMGRSLSLNVTAPILALGAGAVASSIKFEDAMAGVAKTVDASAQTITALGEEFKALSEQIPVAATELANIGEAAGQLGIETSNILGFTRVMADLGVATNLTSTEAATDLARLANITQMPQEQFDRLGATIVALGNNLATTEREIVSMGLRLAGAGKQLGLTEAQVLALGGALSSVGIEAESGGTAMSKVMAEMAIAVGKGGEKLEQFGQIAGMTGEEFAEAFEEDAADALVTFVEGLGRLSDEGVNVFQVLESVEFGNQRVRDALLRAAGAGDLMRRSLELGTKAWRENTALTIEAEKFYATLGNQLKIVWNQIRNMAAEMGDNLKPAVLALIDASKPVLGLLRDMIKGFGELPTGIQAVAIGLVTLTAAAGPALVAIASLTIAIGVLKGAAALGGLATLLSPAGAVLMVVAGLSAAFLVLKGRIDDATQSQKEFAATSRELTKSQINLANIVALRREEEATRKLAEAQQHLASIPPVGAAYVDAADDVIRLHEELDRASADVQRFSALLDGPSASGDGLVFTPPPDTSKQEALARQLQDRLVAMTKTAVDDMQLEYDRLEAHIIEVDGAISASWQTVLDGRQADIAAVGLAEQFPELAIIEDMDDALAKADQLAASLGPGFDLISASANIFRSALEELIDAGLEPANEEYQRILDLLLLFNKAQEDAAEAARDLGKSVGFFGGLEAQAKSILDPTQIASSALGNLLSGGISSLTSAIGGLLGGIFGESEERRANTEAIKKNMEAANRLADNLNALGNETVGLPFDQMLAGLQEGIGRMEFERDRIDRQENISGNKKRSQKRKVQFDESIFEQFGFTLAQVEAFAESLGMDFESLTRDADALIIALESLNTFNRDFGLLQKQFALFDIEDPGEKFASVMDLLAGQVSDGFATVLEGLTPENFDSFLEQFQDGFGDFDKELLGKLDFDQFLTAIGFAEGALDGLATEGEKATEALRNAPAGFKVALARFTASDPELPQASARTGPDFGKGPSFTEEIQRLTKALSEGQGARFTASDPELPQASARTGPDFGKGPSFTEEIQRLTKALSEGQGESTQTITIENVTMHGVNDPREFLSKLEDEVEWRARTGASVIPSKNEMRR